MAKCSNNILPEDILLFQILPRLPNRSLGRFRCVCKQWRSFLTTPAFTNMYLHHVNNNQNHHKVLAVSATKPCNYFCTIDCETPEVGLSANRPMPFEVGSNQMSIISSLNGLVCVGINPPPLCGRYNYFDIILWNPLTGDYKTLSKDNNCFRIPPRGYGLYYNTCDDDYKLLALTQSNDAYIYSWKSDSWRKAKSRVDSLLKGWGSGCLVNGKLYFLARGTQGSSSEMSSSLIIRFDTKTEMFTEIATPPGKCFYMTVLGGCIHLCTIRLELWKMDGDGEWMKVIRSCRSLFDYEPLHLMKNGNWLLCSIRSVNVFKVDRKEENLKKVCEHTIDSTMHIHPRGKFVETIVSLKLDWRNVGRSRKKPQQQTKTLEAAVASEIGSTSQQETGGGVDNLDQDIAFLQDINAIPALEPNWKTRSQD